MLREWLEASRSARNKLARAEVSAKQSRRFVMRVRIPLSVIIAMTVVASVSAQSLPDEVGPSMGHQGSTSQQESITNPGGFGKATNMKAIDPERTDSTGDLDCRKQKDIRTARSARATSNMDCVR